MIIVYSQDNKALETELKNQLSRFINFEIINWENDLDELCNNINQISLDVNPKLYILKNVDYFSTKKNFDENYPKLKFLIENNQQIIITTTLIKDVKEINEFLNIINFLKIKKTSTIDFIRNFLDKNNIKINEELIQEISERLPNDQGLISMELEKLINHQFINFETIDALINDYQTFDIFKLSESILKSDLNSCLKYFSHAISNNISVEEIVAILSSYFLKIYIIKKEMDSNVNVVENFQLNKFWYSNIYKILKNIHINKLKYILNNLFNFDLVSKTINFDKYLNFKFLLLSFFKE